MLFSVNYAKPSESGNSEVSGDWDDWSKDDSGGWTWEDLNPLITNKDSGMTADEYALQQKQLANAKNASYALTSEELMALYNQVEADIEQEKKDGTYQTAGELEIEPWIQKKYGSKKKKKKKAVSPTVADAMKPFPYKQLAATPPPFPWLMVAIAAGAAYFLLRSKGTT
jgi:hypothetical protein